MILVLFLASFLDLTYIDTVLNMQLPVKVPHNSKIIYLGRTKNGKNYVYQVNTYTYFYYTDVKQGKARGVMITYFGSPLTGIEHFIRLWHTLDSIITSNTYGCTRVEGGKASFYRDYIDTQYISSLTFRTQGSMISITYSKLLPQK